jgi:hypothetical protein
MWPTGLTIHAMSWRLYLPLYLCIGIVHIGRLVSILSHILPQQQQIQDTACLKYWYVTGTSRCMYLEQLLLWHHSNGYGTDFWSLQFWKVCEIWSTYIWQPVSRKQEFVCKGWIVKCRFKSIENGHWYQWLRALIDLRRSDQVEREKVFNSSQNLWLCHFYRGHWSSGPKDSSIKMNAKLTGG